MYYQYYYYSCLGTIVIACFNNMLINLLVAYIGSHIINFKSIVAVVLLVAYALCVQSQHKNVYLPFNNDWKVEIL